MLRPDNLFVLTLKNLDSGWQFDCNHDGNILEVKEPVVIQLVVRYSKNFIRSSIHEDFRKCHSLTKSDSLFESYVCIDDGSTIAYFSAT